MEFTIVHPVKTYTGAIDGLQFTDGVAIIDSANTSHIEGNAASSIEDILKRFELKGFTVEGDREELAQMQAADKPTAADAEAEQTAHDEAGAA